MNLAIIFGSSSNEHEISVVSATSIIKNLDKNKYNITPIYLDKENNFYIWQDNINEIKTLKVGQIPSNLKEISSPFEYLKQFDLVFLMIHGKNGEDGVFSNILDFLNIKYVGNKAPAFMITMDKIYTKEILERNNIKTSPYISFTKYNNEYICQGNSYNYQELVELINNNLKYPLFIKPANSGSSIGISKASDKSELNSAINIALKVDSRILIEEMIKGKEVECGILEKDSEVIASLIGEVKPAEEFYSFDAKYTNKESVTIIPANLKPEIMEKIKSKAIQTFKVLNLHTYSRCDFFVTEREEIILNEINTIPGFTEISMYPKLFEAYGMSYSELLDTLINESLNKKL